MPFLLPISVLSFHAGQMDVPIETGRTFIHHDGALGDTLLSLPCIRSIRASSSFLHIAGREDVVLFLKESGIADEVSSTESLFYSSLYCGISDERIRSFLGSFDRAYIFTCHKESVPAANIRELIPDTRTILTIPPESVIEHAAQFRLRQVVGNEDAKPDQDMPFIRNEELLWASEVLKNKGYFPDRQRLITVHPGSGGKKKCWPLKEYAALIQRFSEDPRNFCVVLIGPAEDRAAVSEHIEFGERVILLHDLSLMQAAAMLSLSAYYLGNDSGISHLAGILGCRGSVLFGPTDPAIWSPQGNTLDVVRFMDSSLAVTSGVMNRFSRVTSRHQNTGLCLNSCDNTVEGGSSCWAPEY